jgi:hypothetical protein
LSNAAAVGSTSTAVAGFEAVTRPV